MTTLLSSLSKEITIIFILSPLFIIVLLVAYILKKSNDRVRNFPIYWLLFTMVGATAYLYGWVNDSLSKYQLATFPIVLIGAFQTYENLKVKKGEKKK